MSKSTPPEDVMRAMLTELQVQFSEQGRIKGHAIDFVVPCPWGLLLIDPNGDRWHSWKKVVECDRVKLNRVIAPDHVPLGVWWSRMQRQSEQVRAGIQFALRTGHLPWWDWKVPVEALDPAARAIVDQMLRPAGRKAA